ncbi:MAG: C25 family cysteine peptidase [Muribaculum sp.]|nr:C25 family cysteine peptidase [Muribaculaceae bacterium]MCM1080491.1 C25 family cysteine peptidase [Muribaculum sp.]
MPSILYYSILILMLATNVAVMAYSPSYWKENSVLEKGKWVKVRVDSTGIQQLTYSRLQQLGFANPREVTVWGYSGAMLTDDRFRNDIPDDLPQVAAAHVGDKLLFFGENSTELSLDKLAHPSHSINPYSTAGYYFLTDGRPALEPNTVPFIHSQTPQQHYELAVAERELVNPGEAGTAWFDRPMEDDASSVSYTFSLPRHAKDTDISITYCWAKEKGNALELSLTAEPNLTLSGTTRSRATGSQNLNWRTDSARIVAPVLLDDSVRLNFALVQSAQGMFAAIDWIRVKYTAENRLDADSQMLMFVGNDIIQPLSMLAPDNVQLWDVTSTLSADGGLHRRLVAFNPDATLFTPVVEEMVTPQNLHSRQPAEMLIIAAPELVAQAQELARIHRLTQGMSVEVATTTQVYNEYGSGSPSAYSLRRLVKHRRDIAADKFKYVLLYGTGSYDNRHAPIQSTVPTYQCHNPIYQNDERLTYGTDIYYVMLDNAFSYSIAHKEPPVLAIGRIPAANASEAATYNAKVAKFMGNTDVVALYGTALLSCDLGDAGEHSTIADSHATLLQSLDAGTVINKAYSDMFPANASKSDSPLARQTVIKHMRDGIGLFNYVGHGSAHNLVSKAGSTWLSIPHLTGCNNAHPYLAMLSTCNAICFDQIDNSIGAEILLQPRGGAIAVVGNTRTSVSSYNQIHNNMFLREYAALSPGDTYGKLWLRAATRSMTANRMSNYGSINTIKYLFLGDPALQVPVPESTIDMRLSADTVRPLTPLKLSGRVNAPAFNGTVTVSLYADSTTTLLLGRHESDQAGTKVVSNARLLNTSAAPVSESQFSLDIMLPASAFADSTTSARIIANAVANDSSTIYHGRLATARGFIGGLKLESAPVNASTLQTASITEFYVDEDQPVDASPRFVAAIDGGAAGLNVGQTTLTPGCALFIDSKRCADARLMPLANGTWTLDYTSTPLSDGRHTALLAITDNTGATAHKELSFIVSSREASALISSQATVAHDEIEFAISTTIQSPTALCLIVSDASGQTVHNAPLLANDSSYTWNLKSDKGRRVPPGRYRAFIQSTDTRLYASSSAISFVVL